MNEKIKSIGIRFMRNFIMSLIVLLPILPSEIDGLKSYLLSFLCAILFSTITALDKAIRSIDDRGFLFIKKENNK